MPLKRYWFTSQPAKAVRSNQLATPAPTTYNCTITLFSRHDVSHMMRTGIDMRIAHTHTHTHRCQDGHHLDNGGHLLLKLRRRPIIIKVLQRHSLRIHKSNDTYYTACIRPSIRTAIYTIFRPIKRTETPMQDTVKSVSDTLFLKNNNNAFINIGVARIYDL